MHGYHKFENHLRAAFSAEFGERFSDGDSIRDLHGRDQFYLPVALPDGVVFAESEEDVIAAVRLCARHNVPLVPFAIGSSVEGHVLPIFGGISLDVRRMNRITAVNANDMDATVEPGVTRTELNAHLRDTGLFFSVDPGADATIGGMAATRASGTNAVRYGTMREVVTGLRVVLADGRVIHTGTRARKSAAGYDLTRLFVGSEGTLGVITSVTVRLFPRPDKVSAAVVSFPDLKSAVEAVIDILRLGLGTARIELLDATQIDACNRYSNLGLAVAPTLFLEFHGTAASVAEQTELAGAMTRNYSGGDFQWAEREEDRSRLWQARHDAAYASLALRPGCRAVVGDVCVPISRLADCVLAARRQIDAAGLLGMILGHVGDGNFHSVLLVDPADPNEIASAKAVTDAIVDLALSCGGTSTGEHGIGIGKKAQLEKEHGEAVDVMRALKRALDPHNIMNPGKIFDFAGLA